MSTKHGFMPASGLPPQTAGLGINRPVSRPSPKGLRNWLTGLQNTTVLNSVWDLLVNIGSLFSISRKKRGSLSPLPIPNTPNRKREQDKPQRCKMDLQPLPVRHEQSFLYSACWHPPSAGFDTLSVQTHLHGYLQEEPCAEVPYSIQPQAGWHFQRRFGKALPFRHKTDTCPPWGNF